jgi:hypothetical protein
MDALVTPSYPMITACAQIFYITGINALEGPARNYFSVRDDAATGSSQTGLSITTIATSVNRVRH